MSGRDPSSATLLFGKETRIRRLPGEVVKAVTAQRSGAPLIVTRAIGAAPNTTLAAARRRAPVAKRAPP